MILWQQAGKQSVSKPIRGSLTVVQCIHTFESASTSLEGSFEPDGLLSQSKGSRWLLLPEESTMSLMYSCDSNLRAVSSVADEPDRVRERPSLEGPCRKNFFLRKK